MTIQKAKERFHTKLEWLDSWHSFSFGDHYDPKRTNFGALLVLNDDHIDAGGGFSPHSHANMEIITIVLNGGVMHRDSMENNGVINAGEVQRMSAGTGVIHSEMNASFDEPVDLLQIWITPKQRGIPPSYEQHKFRLTKNSWTALADGTLDRKNGDAVYLHQHAKIVRSHFDKGKEITYKPDAHRGTYTFVISGKAVVNDQELGPKDALAAEGEAHIKVQENADILLLEVPLKP